MYYKSYHVVNTSFLRFAKPSKDVNRTNNLYKSCKSIGEVKEEEEE